MHYLLIAIIFAVLRSAYSAAVEAFVTWGLVELLVPAINIGYGYHYLCWFIVGFFVSCIRFLKIFTD